MISAIDGVNESMLSFMPSRLKSEQFQKDIYIYVINFIHKTLIVFRLNLYLHFDIYSEVFKNFIESLVPADKTANNVFIV